MSKSFYSHPLPSGLLFFGTEHKTQLQVPLSDFRTVTGGGVPSSPTTTTNIQMIYGTQQPSLTANSPTFTPLSLPPSAFQYPSEGLSSSQASLTSSPYSTPASSLFPSLAFASLPSFSPVTSSSDHHSGNHMPLWVELL